MNIFISGALRGLGACLTKKFINCGHNVIAGILCEDSYGELEDIKNNQNLKIIKLDVSQQKDIDDAGRYIKNTFDKLDVIINVAGVLLNRKNYIIQDDYSSIEKTFKINTIGPIYLNNVLLDLVKASDNATIINISSETRSIDDVGPMFATYCMSKTAIAQYAFILKATFDEVGIKGRVFAVHPGRMKTAMGAENGNIEPEESANNIYKIAIGEKLAKNEYIYVNYLGEPMLGIS